MAAAAASAGVRGVRDREEGGAARVGERRGGREVGAVSEGEGRACGGVERGCRREQIGRG